LLLAAQPALAQSKIDRGVEESLRRGDRTQRVIITVRAGQRDAIRKALEAHGDLVKSDLSLVGAIAAEVHSEDVAVLAAHRDVFGVSLDAEVRGHGPKPNAFTVARNKKVGGRGTPAPVFATSTLRLTLGLPTLAPPSQAGDSVVTTNFPDPNSRLPVPTGKGIVVAVIDSGIAPVADLSGRINALYDFTCKGCDAGVLTPAYDDYGHGTHIAGLIAASGYESNSQYQGVTPNVKLVGLKVLDKSGVGDTSSVISAIEFVLDNPVLGVDVINLSLGHPIFESAKTDPLVQAVEKAVHAGIAVVISAGNYGINEKTGEIGYAGIFSPGNAPSAITAGAAVTNDTVSRADDRVADFSSRGPTWYDGFVKPDVVAPGVALVSDATSGSTLYRNPKVVKLQVGTYPMLKLSGTSMAAAVTSGVVAAMLDTSQRTYGTKLSPYAVKAILGYTATPLRDAQGKLYDPLTQGSGEVNGLGAIVLASAVNPTHTVNHDRLSRTIGSGSTVVENVTWKWAQNIVWGDNIVWGSAALAKALNWAQNIVWGSFDDNIVWGNYFDDNIVWGNNIVWGDDIVWGNYDDNIVWGNFDDNIVWGNDDDNIVWGNNIVWGSCIDWGDNIVWGNQLIGQFDDDNIVWGNDDDNIVWGNLDEDNIVWGNLDDDNIVWGNDDDNIVWGNSLPAGGNGGIF
jgi:serine protease AprX